MFEDKEVPDVLPEIKHVYISNEEYMKIQSLFSLQPERLNPEDEKVIRSSVLEEYPYQPFICDSLTSTNK